MALITDPDLLHDDSTDNTSSVYIDTTAKTIALNVGQDTLTTDGVTLKCLYSFLKIQWKDDPDTLSKNLPAFPFPMIPITDEAYEFVDGWDFADDASRYLIRTGGWTVRNTSGDVIAQWAGIVGLGSIESNDQLYFFQGTGSPTDFQLTGQVNQAVQILRDDDGDGVYAEGSDFDYRASFTLYGREQGQIFGKSTLSDIGVTEMASQVYRFPISTAADLKILTADTSIKASGTGYPADVAPYDGMTITYHATPQSRSGLVGGSYNFGITVDANGQTLQKAYEFVQYALRQDANINDSGGAVTGKTADPLMHYVGDTLYTDAATNPNGGGTGVFITNFDSQDLNSVYFTDNTGAQRLYPYQASLTLNFNPNLVSDPVSKFWVYFTTLPGATNDWGESGAVLVEDASSADMSGNITGATIIKTFDYDGNVQGGRTAGTDAAITVIAQGFETAQYVKATGTIQRSKSNSVSMVAPLERNAANP